MKIILEDGKEFIPNDAQLAAIKHIVSKYEKKERMSLDSLYKIVYDYFLVGDFDITSRRSELVRCRQYFSIIAYVSLEYSYREIGERLGMRDHTTILTSIRRLQDIMETDENRRNDLINLCSKENVSSPLVYQPKKDRIIFVKVSPPPKEIKVEEKPYIPFIRAKADHTNRNYLAEYGV